MLRLITKYINILFNGQIISKTSKGGSGSDDPCYAEGSGAVRSPKVEPVTFLQQHINYVTPNIFKLYNVLVLKIYSINIWICLSYGQSYKGNAQIIQNI